MLDHMQIFLDLLSYDAVTGEIRWRADRSNQRQGTIAGNIGPNGYRTICVNYHSYYAHHLAFILSGQAPPPKGSHVDHINGRKDDNRLVNLRIVTPAENGRNRTRLNKNNQSGCNGVWQRPDGKFIAYIGVNRRRKNLGIFDSFDAAKSAREAAIA